MPIFVDFAHDLITVWPEKHLQLVLCIVLIFFICKTKFWSVYFLYTNSVLCPPLCISS